MELEKPADSEQPRPQIGSAGQDDQNADQGAAQPQAGPVPKERSGEGNPGGGQKEQGRRPTQGHASPPFPAGNRPRS